MSKKIKFIISFGLCVFLSQGLLFAKEQGLKFPLKGIKIIGSGTQYWNDQFYGYEKKSLYLFTFSTRQQDPNAKEQNAKEQNDNNSAKSTDSYVLKQKKLFHFSFEPDHAKYFPLSDADAVVAWNNPQKILELLVIDSAHRIRERDRIRLFDQVDDLDLRFGQGRRPVLLKTKKKQNENKISIWFDDREQVLFLQDSAIIAGTLQWKNLSVLVVTIDATKPVLKIWQKGLVSDYPLNFIPVFAEFVIINNEATLFAIDSKNTLWQIRLVNGQLQYNRLISNPQFAYVNGLQVIPAQYQNYLALQCPALQKFLLLKTADQSFDKILPSVEEKFFIGNDMVSVGKLSQELFWLESNETGFTYLFGQDDAYKPFVSLDWAINSKAGYPQINVTWKSYPLGQKFVYRYMLDTHPDSLPLPEYRLGTPYLNAKLSTDGKYYLHIQARNPASGWESAVYHIPIFWKYKPDIPSIQLVNEISPYVVTGQKIHFIINNFSPTEYFAEINNIPVYDPGKKITLSGSEAQIFRKLKPGRHYIHIRSRDPRTGEFSPTLHYLFFYQSYVQEYTVGVSDYNKNMGRLHDLIIRYKNAHSASEKNKILRELDEFKKELEDDITKTP